MWSIIAMLTIDATIWAVDKYFTPAPPNRPQQLTQQPTTNEGNAVPLIFGRVRVRQPALAWYGNLQTFEEYHDLAHPVPSPAFFINMLYVIGIPMGLVQPTASMTTQLWAIYAGDSRVSFNPNQVNSTADVPLAGNLSTTGTETDTGLGVFSTPTRAAT